MRKYKSAGLAQLDEDGGIIKGYASTFDREPDAYGDVVAKGAFSESVARWKESGKPLPLLWGHRTDDPAYNIGAVYEYGEDDKGLYIEAAFDKDNEKAQYARKLAQEGRAYQFSFAYEVLDEGAVTLDDGRKANELRKLNIFEVSLVQIPANQNAEVVDVKAGRRNSRKDEDDLRRARDLMDEARDIIDGVLDEQRPEQEPADEPTDEPNADEPTANADEATKANVRALIDEANKLLK